MSYSSLYADDDNPHESTPRRSHQFSHTTAGMTVRITCQCPAALIRCHLSRTCVFPLCNVLGIPSDPPSRSNMPKSTSNSGARTSRRDIVPKKSASAGLRNANGVSSLRQKNIILVKSLAAPAFAACSRYNLQLGKTERMVRIVRLAGGRVRSTA